MVTLRGKGDVARMGPTRVFLNCHHILLLDWGDGYISVVLYALSICVFIIKSYLFFFFIDMYFWAQTMSWNTVPKKQTKKQDWLLGEMADSRTGARNVTLTILIPDRKKAIKDY